ncbi:MAG: glycosyltransferase family 4 protein [Elusimicrobiota bacterium]
MNEARKPKILLLAPWLPFPRDAGSRRIWTACRLLSRRFDFHLLAFFTAGGDDPKRAAAERMADEARYFSVAFKSVLTVDYPRSRSAQTAAGTPLPEEVSRFYSPEMEREIISAVRRIGPDMIHAEFDLMAPYLEIVKSEFPRLPCVLTHHDASSLSFFSSYFREMEGWQRWRRLGDWKKRLLMSKRLFPRFDAVIAVSEGDRRKLARLMPPSRVHSVPTGVDLEHFSGSPDDAKREPESLLYVGHYPHYPNEEAVLRFAREILPLIRAEKPGAVFHVVGSYPTPAILDLARRDPGIIVSGTVDDVKPHEAAAMAMVAPIRLGYGIKGKILEAMASGTPVVSSTSANSGIGAVHGREILLADSPRRFARETIRVLDDRQLWGRLSRQGRQFVEGNHDWAKRAAQLESVYLNALNQHPSRDRPRTPGIGDTTYR